MHLYKCGQLYRGLIILVLAHSISYSDNDSIQNTAGESLDSLVEINFNV